MGLESYAAAQNVGYTATQPTDTACYGRGLYARQRRSATIYSIGLRSSSSRGCLQLAEAILGAGLGDDDLSLVRIHYYVQAAFKLKGLRSIDERNICHNGTDCNDRLGFLHDDRFRC